MNLMSQLKQETDKFKSHRDTPTGRRFELKIISIDCFILTLGVIGLAIWFPPLIYAAAIGHVITGFVQGGKTSPLMVLFGFVSWVVTVAITSAVVFGGTYAVQRFYFGVPEGAVADELISNWTLFVAIGIVMGGIVSTLTAYPGGVDELIEYKNRSGSHD